MVYYNNMYKVLRIIFCVIAAALAAACIFIFVYAGWLWGLVALSAAFVCGALMVLFRQLQNKKERRENPPPPQGDFITGKVNKNDDGTAE